MIPVLTPDGVGERGPSGQYQRMSIGEGEFALVWLGPNILPLPPVLGLDLEAV